VDPIQRVTSREVYRNSWLTFREDEIRRSDGSSGIYSVVDKPAYALVIPLDGDRLHLVEQFRYPLGQRCWEFVQGTAPGLGEIPPAELAARELAEETGLRAGDLQEIGRLAIAPGLTSQTGTVWLARDLTQGEPEREVEEQDMRSAWFDRSDFEKMISTGVIIDAQTLAAYTLLLLHERG
jgi:8-oxo-dGTP pyrophosphatase MutT (NUDIX family)